MRNAILVLVAALAIVLPTAAASPTTGPTVYYLKDDAMGPVANGGLSAKAPSAAQPSLRAIPIAGANLVPIRFQTPSNESHPALLLGPMYVALWMGPSPVLHGNLTATLKLVNKTGSHELANASFPLDANASKLPQPMSLVPVPPAVPPSDPAGYAQYVAFHELSQVLPTIQPPPRFLDLGFVYLEVGPNDQLALDLSITKGSSAVPVPQGAVATLQYDSILAPSFVYAPWYQVNPAPPIQAYEPPPWTAQPPYSSSPSDQEPSDPPSEAAKENTPAPGLLLAFAAVGLAVLVRRRT